MDIFGIIVDINCCYPDLGMDIFRNYCGYKLLLLGHRHGHFRNYCGIKLLLPGPRHGHFSGLLWTLIAIPRTSGQQASNWKTFVCGLCGTQT